MDRKHVRFSARRGGTLHRAIGLLDLLPRELCLVGGTAVVIQVAASDQGRLPRTHSWGVTVDVDALTREMPLVHEKLSILAVNHRGEGLYTMPGGLHVDVIETTSLASLLDTDWEFASGLELAVLAHAFANTTAEFIDVTAVDEATGERLTGATGIQVASVIGLIVMKAATSQVRREPKRFVDLVDLAWLLNVWSQEQITPEFPSQLTGTVTSALDEFRQPRILSRLRYDTEGVLEVDRTAEMFRSALAKR